MSAPAGPPFVDLRGWVAVDRLLVALFREAVELPDAVAIDWVTALKPGDEQTFPAGLVERLPGGGINVDGYEDVSRIQVTTFGRTRPESDVMTTQVRQALADLANGEYAGVGLDRISEETGPGRIFDPNLDLRAVPTVWTVVARNQRL